MPERAHASPTKQFFLSMITKDISLEDCILDLLDNSIDGARKYLGRLAVKGNGNGATKTSPSPERLFEGFSVTIDFNSEKFHIKDNCGGITVSEAIDYAFHFGRRRGSSDPQNGIGLYGIGMKRAMFKIGRKITVRSSTEDEGFVVPIDVDEWEKDVLPASDANRQSSTTQDSEFNSSWDFDLTRTAALGLGTEIEVTALNRGIDEEFQDITFQNRLIETIGRDYSLFLQRGLQVTVNNSIVAAHEFALMESSAFEPLSMRYDDDGVAVEILAGISKSPPDDDSADVPQPSDVDYFGWFVACNDRIVLAGNKDDRTVWGDATDHFPAWHPQYNGFLGITYFNSADPSLLPWTTTKRDVDTTMPIYQRAVVRMKAVTREFINYTNARKLSLEDAKLLEAAALARPIENLSQHQQFRVPVFAKRQVANISYSVPLSHYEEVAKALGNPYLSRKEVGLRTFAYYREREVAPEEQ